MGTLKSGKFWAGIVVGTIFGGSVLAKVAPGLKSKIPGA